MDRRVTLLIQGRVNEYGMRMVNRYRGCYPIVISASTLSEEYQRQLEEYQRDDPTHFKLILRSPTHPMEYVYNKANCYYQMFSTYMGLQEVDTEYTMKFRGDEYYSDISPLVHSITTQEKLVTSDIFFRKQLEYNQVYLYHTSDHYFGARTRHLLIAFHHLKRLYEEVCYSQENEPDLSFQYSFVFEQKLTIAYLLAMGERNLPKNTPGASKLLLKYVDMVKSCDMGEERVVTANVHNKIYLNDTSYYNPNLDIGDMSELA